MNLTRVRYLFLLLAVSIAVNACKKKWEDDNMSAMASAGQTLLEQIKGDPNLSRFAGLLEKSEYVQVLASSKTFTVWAPNNEALAALPDSIESSATALNAFVGTHISNQVYTISAANPNERIPMINGKYENVTNHSIDSAEIVQSNQFAKNGVLHIIDKPLPVLGNIWDVILTDPRIPKKQMMYMKTMFRNAFDSATAVRIGVDSNGRPVYQEGTDSSLVNIFWQNAYDLSDESGQYTFFVMEDAGWEKEVNKMLPYFVSRDAATTLDLASFDIIKDLAFDSVYRTVSALPTVLKSKFDTKLYLPKTEIKHTINTSNGVIYVISAIPVEVGNRLKEIRIEAENYYSTSANRLSNTYLRERVNPISNEKFDDILVYNHGYGNFAIRYRVEGAYSARYKAYWVALNDFQTTTFSQKLAVDSLNATALPYQTVPINSYLEQYLGEVTISEYKSTLNVYLIANNTTPIVCDYIRLVPVP